MDLFMNEGGHKKGTAGYKRITGKQIKQQKPQLATTITITSFRS